MERLKALAELKLTPLIKLPSKWTFMNAFFSQNVI